MLAWAVLLVLLLFPFPGIMAQCLADVELPRPIDTMTVPLQLQPMADPPHCSRQRKYGGKHGHRQTHGTKQYAGVKIDIRVKFAFDEILVVDRHICAGANSGGGSAV